MSERIHPRDAELLELRSQGWTLQQLGERFRLTAGGVHAALAKQERRNLLAVAQAAQWLLALKDGPRDDAYLAQKEPAWQALRGAIGDLHRDRRRSSGRARSEGGHDAA